MEASAKVVLVIARSHRPKQSLRDCFVAGLLAMTDLSFAMVPMLYSSHAGGTFF